jgi:hypothetical protein
MGYRERFTVTPKERSLSIDDFLVIWKEKEKTWEYQFFCTYTLKTGTKQAGGSY